MEYEPGDVDPGIVNNITISTQPDLPGPDLLEGDLDTGPHQAQHGVQDLQQGRRLEDLESEAGSLVEAGDTFAGSQVAAGLVEEVAPAKGLDGVVGHQVESAHGGALLGSLLCGEMSG